MIISFARLSHIVTISTASDFNSIRRTDSETTTAYCETGGSIVQQHGLRQDDHTRRGRTETPRYPILLHEESTISQREYDRSCSSNVRNRLLRRIAAEV